MTSCASNGVSRSDWNRAGAFACSRLHMRFIARLELSGL
jgi:hypothetical protein